jgi:hypothetical protein
MELNAEQIKYCLELILKSGIGMSRDDVDVTDIKRALALINSQEQRIKELTEENERLRAIPEQMKERLQTHFGTYVLGYKIPLSEALKAVNQIAKEMLEGE